MTVDTAIKERKTEKVLAEKPWPIHKNDAELKALASALLDLAAMAPYHYPCSRYHTKNKTLTSCLPFRIYVLDTKNCRLVSEYITSKKIIAGKIQNMLDAADLLFMVTWLPEESVTTSKDLATMRSENIPFEGSLKNMEHIAAASAAVQNLLVGATERNIPNYWSSGGVLRKKELRNLLDIPLDEILLGGIFMFPEDSADKGAEIKFGAHRANGKEINTWSRWTDLS
ncbi:MAG: hypothetical protein ACPHXR_04610 [Flavicella sp.]